MKIIIEGWEPTPVEKSLLDGTLDSFLAGADIQDVPEDLRTFKEFGEAMEDIKRELWLEFGEMEDAQE